MKLILLLKNKIKYITIFTMILLIFSCIRKEWENPLDSDNSLDIIPSISITRPSSSDELYFGFKEYVIWDNHEYDDNVKIILLKDGNIIDTIANEVPNNKGEFRWTVPLTGIEFGKDYSIIVSSTTNQFVKDTSKIFIMRQAPEIEIEDINDGVPTIVDYTYPIKWQADSLNHYVRIECYENNIPKTIISDSTENNGEFDEWIIPIDYWPKHYYKIRISSTYNPAVKQEKDFEVTWPDFTLKYPTDGKTLIAGARYDLKWSAPLNKRDVWLDLYNWNTNSDQNGWVRTIVDTTENDSSYSYLLPIDLIIDDSYQINIGNIGNRSIQAITTETYTEWPKFGVIWPNLYITYPNNGDELFIDQEYQVKWGSSFNEFSPDNLIKITLILDGNEIQTLVAETNNTRQWNWNLEQSIYLESTNYQIKIETVGNAEIFGLSAPFSIRER